MVHERQQFLTGKSSSERAVVEGITENNLRPQHGVEASKLTEKTHNHQADCHNNGVNNPTSHYVLIVAHIGKCPLGYCSLT